MSEELEKQIDEEKLEQLIGRIREAYDNGVLKMRDWMAIYEILLEACRRKEIVLLENYLTECLDGDDSAEEEE